jgi:PAS domain-containing protein
MIVTYDTRVVVFSVVSAVITSYVALNLAGNTVASGRARHFWLAGGAIAIGTGIWSVYFIIMLANKLAISMESDSLITLAVLGVAIIVSGLAVYSLSRQQVDKLQFLIGSQRRMATLIDSMPGIVFSCSNEIGWSKTYLSEGCLNLTGYQSEELLASETINYNAITHPEDLSKVLQIIEAAIRPVGK